MLDILAQRIHDQVYRLLYDYKTTVFLCGAGKQEPESVREKIDRSLRTHSLSYMYDMFYPEDLFHELFFGPGHHDLVTLENILADSVDAIVLVVESYGAVAELGVFASNPRLRKRLVCIVDEKHKKEKSFINYGPLRLLRSMHEGEVVYGDYQNIEGMMQRIRRAISKARRLGGKSAAVRNVVQTHHFILPSIFLLQPVSRHTLVELVVHASGTSTQVSTALTAGALSILDRNREIELSPDGYKLTEAGMEHFQALGRRGWSKRSYSLESMDKMRVAVLNWKYRGKPLRI